MSSAAKALALLSHFSTALPEIGLSQLCRIANHDKATTYRYLQVLEGEGFVEQNPSTKRYRLGPAVMNLAHIREATVPRKASARDALEILADATGETAHVTVMSGTTLYALDNCESPKHGTRAIMDNTEFPLHATASGMVALAFGAKELTSIATADLREFTRATPTTSGDLSIAVDAVRQTGFGRANQSFETGVYAIAAPVFDQNGIFAGAVSVASVASRVTTQLEQIIQTELIVAAREITRNWGGTMPAHVEAAWSHSLTQMSELETA